jgi:alpha-L-arabinofuranosidase
VLQLYRQQFGTTPIALSGVPAPLDAVAALSSDGRALTIAIVNPTGEPKRMPLKVAGGTLRGDGLKWTITGADKWAHNAPGAPRGVDIASLPATQPDVLEAGPLSVTLYSLRLR